MPASPPRASFTAPAPPTPRATPARRAKSSAGSDADELARAEVLELTLFAEKKEWIEDKITFLSTLPPIEVVSPSPPEVAAASRRDLDDWWAEHDRIETEVDEYDMGDLARMREFARDKSKQALSPRDTDLIEITLTTLFAVDRLLHLLRQRRKALTLLGYRLQWEDAVAAAWTAHRQILSDLPAYLAKARWEPPTSPRSCQSTGEPSLPSSPTLSPSPSLPSFSSSHSLAQLASSTSSSLASSARTQLLALQLSSLISLSRTLSTSLLPSSAAALDKLIDASPTPLPEPFLDEQDRLEAECARAVDGLPAFLAAVRAQRDAADALLAEADALAAQAGAPDADAPALQRLRAEALPALHAALSRLPAPAHPLAPDQPRLSAALHEVLEGKVRAAEEALRRAEARASARERAKSVREQVRRGCEVLRELRGRMPPPVQGLVSSPAASSEELAHDAALTALDPPVQTALAAARALQAEAARTLVAAQDAGLPREVRRGVRDAAEELRVLAGEVEAALEDERRRGEERDTARGVLRAVDGARALADEAAGRLEAEAQRARWREDGEGAATEGEDAQVGASVLLAEVRAAQEAILDPALARVAELVAQGRPLPLAQPAEELVRAVRAETSAQLEALARLLDAARAQAIAVRTFSAELTDIESDVARVANEVDAAHDRPPSPEPLDPVEAELDTLASSLAALSSSAHARIPLLASPSAAAAAVARLDLPAQDATVREFVNSRCARAAGAVEEVRRGLREVEHGWEARAWDEEVERVEGEVPLLAHLNALRTTTLPALSSSLTNVLASPAATSPRFVSPHAARQTRLGELTARAFAAREKLLRAQAEQHAQRAALLAALSAQGGALDGLAEEARCAARGATVAQDTLAGETATLLSSRDLDERSAPDLAPLEQLERTAADLRERLDESLAALDALWEQEAPPSPADEEHAAALAAASRAGDEARTACDELTAAVLAAREGADAWPAARAEELLRRRREAWREEAEELVHEVEGARAEVEQVEEESREALALDGLASDGVEALAARLARVQAAEAELCQQRALLEGGQPAGAIVGALGEANVALERLGAALPSASSSVKELAARTHAVDELASADEATPATPADRLVHGAAALDEDAGSGHHTPHDVAIAPVLVLPTTPSPPPTLRQSLGSLGPPQENGDHNDPFFSAPDANDPFALPSSLDEPLEVVQLRQRMQEITAHEWLDSSAVMQLPTVADADEVDRLVAHCRKELDSHAQLPHEQLLWTDLDALQAEQERKEAAAARVSSLALFAERVIVADTALSDLLIAIDTATPGVPAPSPEPGGAPALSLSDALVAASEAVTAVRVDAIPLVDDARVERAIGRIEESWSEMLALVEDVRPRAGSAASSASSSSLRRSTRSSSRLGPTPYTPSRPTSQASSLRSSVRDDTSSRTTSRASTSMSTRSPRPPSVASSTRRESNGGFLIPQTPRARKSTEPDPHATPTSRRRGKSALPVATTPRRAFSPALKPTPTAAHPFSFDTPNRRDLSRSTSSIPRRSTASSSSRRDSSTSIASTADSLFSPKMQRTPSASSSRSVRRESAAWAQQPARRTSLASSRASLASTRSPRVSSASTPPSRRGGKAQPYRPNMQNKLDREVGSIINALPLHVQVPIRIAEGRWTDESGVYNIGGRLYFCRILRSKQVMVRVGGGWLNLLQFIIAHFGQADGLTISPSTSLSKNLGTNKPQWISADTVRDQLAASTSGTSIRDLLAAPVSSAGKTDLGSSTSSMSLRRSFGGHVNSLRRSISGKAGLASVPPASPASTTPRTSRTPRPPVPIWRP
ncbi:hypothetical protein JCM10450v2_004958 [Rhodotorula kratochvilovae]